MPNGNHPLPDPMAAADVVVCGAGMAGAAAAYHLTVARGLSDVVVVDPREPLTLTSDKGTQGYRNWFDGPDDTMTRFVGRSITILEELAERSGNAFRMARPGYAFVTGAAEQVARLRGEAARVCSYGAGAVREHPGPHRYQSVAADEWRGAPDGVDLLLDPALVRQHFPFVSGEAIAVSHVRRAGWVDAVALGRWLLAEAERHGARMIRDRVDEVTMRGGRVAEVRFASGARLGTGVVVLAAGPELPAALRMLDLEFPLLHELHAKLRFHDRIGVVPRSAPFTIWTDPIAELPWTSEERRAFSRNAEDGWLLGGFPGGVHVRPVGGRAGSDIFVIWTFEEDPSDYRWPPTFDGRYGEVLLRGLGRMVPGAAAYYGEGHRGTVDGGYYMKTPENRPLVGPLPVEGAYVTGALSGYGIMAAHAAGDLLSAHVTGSALPAYAAALSPARYDNASYRAAIARWDARAGQL